MYESMIRLKGAQVILYYSYIPICYNYSAGAMHSGFSYKIAKKIMKHFLFLRLKYHLFYNKCYFQPKNNRIVCKYVVMSPS